MTAPSTLADINVAHTNPNDMYNSGHVELLRMTTAAWTPMPLSPGAPRSQLALIQVDGGIVTVGSACPGIDPCTLEDGAAALLRPDAHPGTIPLQPKPGVPYPNDIAAGGQAIVVTYPEGLGAPLLPPDEPAPGSSQIYDIAAGAWLRGPTAPYSQASIVAYWGAYWTPYGVVSLGRFTSPAVASAHFGGWLLWPAH
jgi:hypothetical protein